MIENICSNMAGKEKEYPVSGRKPPKNVRQIGAFTGNFRIYVEDYVHTFTHWLAEQDHTERSVAVLVGEFAKSEYAREVYAYGAVTAKQACVDGKIEMSAQVWTQIYETIKHYFPDGEIVGWFCGGTSFTAEEKEEIWKVHLDHFAGADRILLLYDFLDQEEEFYRYEEGEMARQEGYYIYYEKNTEMQNYMIDQKQGKSNEECADDRAVREVRARWNAEKKGEGEETAGKMGDGAPQKGGGRFLYSVGIVMTAVALIAAASMLYNQERLKGFEQTLNKLLGNTEEDGEPDVQEVSGKGGNEKEKEKEKENSGGNGVMAWEITSSTAPKRSDDPLSDMEKAPDIQDSTSNITGDVGDEQKNDGQTSDEENSDGQDGIKQNGDGQGETDQTDNEKTSDGENKTGQTGDGENSDGQSGIKQSGDGQGETDQTGDEKTSDGETDASGEDSGKGEISDGKEDNPEKEENSPKPGDAVQTGEIGGPGVAVDTSKMQIYTVKPGDTLVGICKKFYGNLEQLEYIKDLNQINNENLIYVDQELVLP